MGVRDWLGMNAAPPIVERPLERSVFDHSVQVRAATTWALGLAPEKVWTSQPYVRTVVTFLARNIAQLGVHAFHRVDDITRERLDREHPVAQMLRRPNASTTMYELIFGLVSDKALYDRAYWLIGRDSNGVPTLTRLPPARVIQHVASDPLGAVDTFRVQDAHGSFVDIAASRVLYFPGWNPTTAVGLPTSPLDAIKSVIAEQAAAFEFRKLSWEHGTQVGQTISRPTGVPWKEGARDRFMADVRSQFSNGGPRRGGVMLLEDGMTLSGEQFNAREAEWIDAAKLSLALVAAVYHVNPTMVGLLDNANYSNVREFRKMLYGDTLGPIIASIEDRVNTMLLPRFVDDGSELYVEFNIAEKLQGSFEEQAAAMQTSVGAPWMTRSEARARLNLPPLADGDQLVVPLNVLTGGQASPRDSAPPPKLAQVVSLKARATEAQQRKISEVLSSFFDRQARSVLSRLGAGADDWWDEARWDSELADILHPLVVAMSTALGRTEAERLGFAADDFDEPRTIAYLRGAAERYAASINATTRQQVEHADQQPDAEPADVFVQASDSRASGVAIGLSTFAAGFASREAARHVATAYGVEPTKTWVTGPNARPSHAAMNGQTVGIEKPFSNGMQWPAESGGVDEVAGCNCSIEVSIGT